MVSWRPFAFARLQFFSGLVGLSLLPDVVRSEFLAHSPGLQVQLVSQIEQLFGQGASDGRVERFEARMRPMYEALPKESNNKLAQQAARYALHRYFASYHAWNIEGLSPRGNLTNSPVIALDGRAPAAVKDLVEGRLEKRGFSLRDLATFAAMLELLVRAEVVERLTEAYHSLSLQLLDDIDDGNAQSIISWHYMISWLAADGVDGDSVAEYNTSMDQIYPGWADTVMFIHDMRQNVDFSDRHARNPFVQRGRSFDDMVRITEAINDRFGHFQNFECRKLKDTLLEREYRGTGRIPLQDFYGLALYFGEWRFSEKAEYLRDVGVLDDTDPQNPSVIITNYLQSPSNCLGASHFYSVCCLDECEGLLGHLEENIAAPEAAAEEILSLISGLPSSTVAAPRNLSMQLVARLHEVASFHGGHVPLHGRLFAQWMHHAYPRECPYPHVAGTTKQMAPNDWAIQKAQEAGVSVDEASAGLSPEELEVYITSNHFTAAVRRPSRQYDELDDESSRHGHESQQQQLPHLYAWSELGTWREEEELFAGGDLGRRWGPWQLPSRVGARALLRNFALLAALSAAPDRLTRTLPAQTCHGGACGGPI